MKQLGTVFNFELMNYLKKRSYILLSIILVLLIGVSLSWPRIQLLLGTGSGKPSETKTLALAGVAGKEADFFVNILSDAGFEVTLVDSAPDTLEHMVESGEYQSAVLITSPLAYTRFERTVPMVDPLASALDSAMKQHFQESTLASLGVADSEIQSFMNAKVAPTVVTTKSGKDQMQNFFYTYAMIFLLYFAVIMYGQFVASSVATEKSTRAMELLITSTDTNSLMFGKVLGTGTAGLLQLGAILGSAFIFYNLNASFYTDNFIVQSMFAIPLPTLLFVLLFFVLGFFIYAFLFASLASLVSRMEDLSTVTLPVTYLFIIAFMVVMFSMGSGKIDSPLMIFCSYFPLTSPMAMFARISMGEVSSLGILLSVLLLGASTIGIGLFASSLYRLGVLLYGNAPKPKEIIRMLKASKQ